MIPSFRPGPWRPVRGQALTEFLVISVALIPLFLLVPMIAKYQDISHFTQLSSRYAAFDAMTRNDSVSAWKPEAQLADEVRRRFFSNSDAPIKTGDVAGNFDANRNLFWTDPAGNHLVTDLNSDITVTYGTGNGASHTDGFQAASDKALFVLADPLQLKTRGIYRTNVAIKLAKLPAGLRFYEPFDAIDLSMTRSTSLLLDPWTARDPQQVEQKILASPVIFPAGNLASVSSAVNAVVSVVDAPGGISGPKLGQLDFWRDVVPEDRLHAQN
jgi:hypothetical protein